MLTLTRLHANEYVLVVDDQMLHGTKDGVTECLRELKVNGHVINYLFKQVAPSVEEMLAVCDINNRQNCEYCKQGCLLYYTAAGLIKSFIPVVMAGILIAKHVL